MKHKENGMFQNVILVEKQQKSQKLELENGTCKFYTDMLYASFSAWIVILNPTVLH